MPEENKIKKEDPKVDIDTSGPEVDVTLPEEKNRKRSSHGTGTSPKRRTQLKKKRKRRTSKRRTSNRGPGY